MKLMKKTTALMQESDYGQLQLSDSKREQLHDLLGQQINK